MTILSSIVQVANECGYTVDTTRAIGSTDPTTVQILAMGQRIIKEMGEAYPWTKLYRNGSITLVSGDTYYALPADFSYYHHDTFWNSSQRWPMYGPLSPQYEADIIGYGLTAATYSQFQIRGVADKRFYIYPTPSASGDVVTYQYMAARYVRPRQWVTGMQVTSGSYCFNDGNYYTAGSTGVAGATAPTGTTTSNDGNILWTYYDGTYTSFLADTDVGLFSERVFEQGLKERFAEIKQLAFEPRFIAQLNEEFSRDIPGQTIYAGDYWPDYVLQARSGVVVFGKPL